MIWVWWSVVERERGFDLFTGPLHCAEAGHQPASLLGQAQQIKLETVCRVFNLKYCCCLFFKNNVWFRFFLFICPLTILWQSAFKKVNREVVGKIESQLKNVSLNFICVKNLIFCLFEHRLFIFMSAMCGSWCFQLPRALSALDETFSFSTKKKLSVKCWVSTFI